MSIHDYIYWTAFCFNNFFQYTPWRLTFVMCMWARFATFTFSQLPSPRFVSTVYCHNFILPLVILICLKISVSYSNIRVSIVCVHCLYLSSGLNLNVIFSLCNWCLLLYLSSYVFFVYFEIYLGILDLLTVNCRICCYSTKVLL
jgi:hypothetical protein